LRVPNSGEAYARYLIDGSGALGDFPTTVWALLNSTHVLRFDDGSLLLPTQRAELLSVARSNWRWLTQTAVFDPQKAQNQALGAVVAGLKLSAVLRQSGRPEEAAALRRDALTLYREKIRARRIGDRGFRIFHEHGGYDQNYGVIALGFAAEAYHESGSEGVRLFREDGAEMARYMNMRLSVNGYDYEGTRHDEAKSPYAGLVGLNLYDKIIRRDLGRTLAHPPPDASALHPARMGHFAFMTVANYLRLRPDWYRARHAENAPFKLRRGNTSLVFDAKGHPFLVSVADTEIVQGIVNGEHGIGPVRRAALPFSEWRLLGTDTAAPPDVARADTRNFALRFARAAVPDASSDHKTATPVETTYVTDGQRIDVIARVGAPALYADGTDTGYLLGLPYLYAPAPGDDGWHKVLEAHAVRGSRRIDLGEAAAMATFPDGVRAGGAAIRGNGAFRVENPPPGAEHFNSPETIRFPLDRGRGWKTRIKQTNRFVLLSPQQQSDRIPLVLRYGRNGDPAPSVTPGAGTLVRGSGYVFAALHRPLQNGVLSSDGPVAVFVDRLSGEVVVHAGDRRVLLQGSGVAPGRSRLVVPRQTAVLHLSGADLAALLRSFREEHEEEYEYDLKAKQP
ncbi:MAG: hypothetical protein KY468_10965, partial [Armatimonadetes bacterium]|nr:hypothetical protein [Armatimonadota bacterium]